MSINGESLKPLRKKIDYLGTAHGVSTKEAIKELEKLKKASK